MVTRLERERGLPQIPSDRDRNELWLAGYPPGDRSVVGEDEAVRTVGRGVVLGQHHQVASPESLHRLLGVVVDRREMVEAEVGNVVHAATSACSGAGVASTR